MANWEGMFLDAESQETDPYTDLYKKEITQSDHIFIQIGINTIDSSGFLEQVDDVGDGFTLSMFLPTSIIYSPLYIC